MALINTPKGAVGEFVSMRTLHSKVFDMGNDHCKLVALSSCAHVPSNVAAWQRGEVVDWEDIDTDFERTVNGFVVKNAWYTCLIELDRLAWTYTSKAQGRLIASLEQIGDTAVADLNLSYNPVLMGNKLYIASVLPGLDFEFEAKPSGLYLYKILHNSGVPRDFTWRLEWPNGSPLRVNTATQGRDNYLRNARSHNGRLETIQRRIQMNHETSVVAAADGHEACLFREQWTGQTLVRDAERRLTPSVECMYPVWIDQDVIEPIAVTADDGYEYGGAGAFIATYVQNFLGYFSSNDYLPGLRFTTLAIPQGQSISLAELIVEQLGAPYNSGTTLTLRGYNTDNAVAWNPTVTVPSTVATTTASATMDLTGAAGTKTFDVTSIVQEIVNRGGWASGNSMSFVGLAPTPTGGNNGTYIGDYSNPAPNTTPILEVTFTPAGGGGVTKTRTMPAGWSRRRN